MDSNLVFRLGIELLSGCSRDRAHVLYELGDCNPETKKNLNILVSTCYKVAASGEPFACREVGVYLEARRSSQLERQVPKRKV